MFLLRELINRRRNSKVRIADKCHKNCLFFPNPFIFC